MRTTASPTATLDAELNELVLGGRALEAFDRYYAEQVVMQENSKAPVRGKAANRAREVAFFDSVETWHDAKLLSSAVEGDRSCSEWLLDVSFEGGQRARLEQVAVRQWRDGLVVSERFYYDTGK